MATHAAPNIVNNGGFEAGNLTGSTQLGNTTFSGVRMAVIRNRAVSPPSSGQSGARVEIYQTLATAPGNCDSSRFGLMNEADVVGNAQHFLFVDSNDEEPVLPRQRTRVRVHELFVRG